MRARHGFVAVAVIATALPGAALLGAAEAGTTAFAISVADPSVELKEAFTVDGRNACASSPYTATFVFTTRSGSGEVTASGTTDEAGAFTEDITVPETALPEQPASVQATVTCPGETTTAPPTTEPPTTAPPTEDPTTAPPTEDPTTAPPTTEPPTTGPPTSTVEPTTSTSVDPTTSGGAAPQALPMADPQAQEALRLAAIQAAVGTQPQAAGPNSQTSNTVDIQLVVATGVLSTDKAQGRAGTVVQVHGTHCLGDDVIVVFGSDAGAERVAVTLLPDDTFDGSYAIPNVPPGEYFFAAQCPGTDYADRPFSVLATPGASPSPLPPANPIVGRVDYTA
jgi:hypothetical protein